MKSLKDYLLKHIEDTLILSILATVAVVNFWIQDKLAFLDVFYLLVVLAGYYIGKRFAVLGAFFAILMIWVFLLSNKSFYYSGSGTGTEMSANLNLTVWGGFLILAAWLVGSLAEKLRAELEETRRLREDLHQEQELLKASNQQLREYSTRLEEKVAERTRDLQQSNQELMAFAFTASHDLQEPLRKIAMFGDRLADRVPKDDAKSHDYLERMCKSARRMQEFIHDLLQLSGIALGKPRPPQKVSLQQLAHQVVDDLEGRIMENGGEVTIRDLPVLEADELQMQQLFQNLIGNALKYHRAGVPPRVEVSARPLREGFWEITVADNGIGIDPHQVQKIFQPFHRTDRAALFEGSGIGLTICKKIVDRHGGIIQATSQINQGATFIFTLPEKCIYSNKSHSTELASA